MSKHFVLCVAGTAVLFSTLTAAAQDTESERPYRGVFGSGFDRFEQTVTVNGSTGVGYDTSPSMSANEVGAPVFIAPTTEQFGTGYRHFSGGLSYGASLNKLSLGASVSSAIRQFQEDSLRDIPNHAASVSAGLNDIHLGKRTSLSASLAGSYQAIRGFMPFPVLPSAPIGPVEVPVADYGSGLQDYYGLTTGAGVTHQLSTRSALTASYSGQRTVIGDSGSNNLTNQSGAFRYTHGLTRNLNLRLGYGYNAVAYNVDQGQRYKNHTLDTGVDYNRALSLTRRTKLSFSSGATVVQSKSHTRVDAIGSAVLSHEIGRTWNTSVSYLRNVGFTEFALEPVFSDSISANLGGLITRSLTFQAGAGVSRGSVGFEGPANGFGAWSGFAGVSRALGRYLSLSANYTYYHYNFQPGAALLTPLMPNTHRQSVSVMLNAWAPVFQHGRKANAPR